MALGAAPRTVVRLVVSHVAALLIGIVAPAGIASSVWLSRYVAALLYDLEPQAPLTLTVRPSSLRGALAGWLSAHRAAQIGSRRRAARDLRRSLYTVSHIAAPQRDQCWQHDGPGCN
jgi:hypothetical protein